MCQISPHFRDNTDKMKRPCLVSITAGGNVVNSPSNGFDLIGIMIRDFDRELFLDGHDNFNSIERVQLEIIREVGCFCDL